MTEPPEPRGANASADSGAATEQLRLELPLLSRGTADRDETLRTAEHATVGWPTARVIRLDPSGGIELDGGNPRWRPAADAGAEIPPGAVLLGTVDGVDHWALTDASISGSSLRDIGADLDDTDAGLLVTAVALLTWHRRSGFCPTCGAASRPTLTGWSRTCPNGHQEFPRTDPAVIVLVHDGADNLVLARQPSWPAGRYSVLAGFNEAGESLEATVRREILEEVGVQVDDVRYLGSQPWPFPRSLMIAFTARAEPEATLTPQDGEIEQARWVSRAELRRALQRDTWVSRDAKEQAAPHRPAAEVAPELPGEAPTSDELLLPGPVSIAHRMLQAWAAQRTADGAGPPEHEPARHGGEH
nr:NAD(+) diphosphatase [Nakamurella aerolata]